MREQVIREIQNQRCIAIVRSVEPEKLLPLAQALSDGGITMIEVTFDQRRPEAFFETADAISGIKSHLQDRVFVGAGTVTAPELVDMAAQAGAGYIISPDTDPAVIARTRELGLVSIPGAYTPTEAKLAHNAGADFVKLFPCIGGPAWLKALAAPLSHIKFLAVGGITSDNAGQFIRAGAWGVGVGGNLVNKTWIQKGAFDKITAEARKLMAAVQEG